MNFFENPILNSPYRHPGRHWQLDEDGRPTNLGEHDRRSSALWTALPGASAKSTRARQAAMVFEEGLSTEATELNPSPIVNDLRQALAAWRALPNPSQWMVNPTTQRLLQHWRSLQADEGQRVRPFFCQLEAVEAAIWLAEVAPQAGPRGRRFLDWIAVANNFALQPEGAPASKRRPDLARIAFKLATGAGKTTVMAMLIAWQTLNAVRSPNSRRFSKAFLVVAPGITIRDRLRVLLPNDPESYYRTRKLVPSDLLPDLGRARVVITNYHAFKPRETFDAAKGTREALQGHGEPLATAETEGQMLQRVMGDLMGERNVVVINDEAHHCYRERPEAAEAKLTGDDRKEAEENKEAARLWLSGLEALNRHRVEGGRPVGVRVVYDLSATPFFLSGSGWPEGTLFPWVMSDFSLMDAIECGIVKLPRVPIADNLAQGEEVLYRDLWPRIRGRMPKKQKGEAKPDPQKIPIELKTALDALYGHYEKTFRDWEKAKVGVPPVFIVVCNNTTNSEMLRDYIAGYTVTDADGQETVTQGKLDLFRNHDDHDQRLDRLRTILIDSAALEGGGDIDKTFREAHATEIEAFRRERLERGGGAEAITDAEILREVMNTIGRRGRLGEQVRCVVSVSMLTEGWDANTVTHCQWRRERRPGGRRKIQPRPLERRSPRHAGGFCVFAGVRGSGSRLARAALREAVGRAVHLEDVDVVGEPVEQSAGEALVPEGRRPLVEGQVGGDDRGAALVTLADQLEEELGAGPGQRDEAELVDDQQLVGGERLLEPQQPLVVASLDHLMDDGRGGGEARLHPPLAGGEAEADHGVGLARAARPEGDDVLAAGDEVAPRQIEHQLLVEPGMASKSKLSRLLTAGKRASRMRRSTVRASRSRSSSSIGRIR